MRDWLEKYLSTDRGRRLHDLDKEMIDLVIRAQHLSFTPGLKPTRFTNPTP